MTVEEILTNIKTKLTTNLANINAKLTAKGQTAANTLSEVPAKIEAIETGVGQDVLSLVSGLTKYTESFTVDGEERANVLVQPSDFSDESVITWSTSTSETNYFTHSIESVDGSENGYAAVITPTTTTTTSYSHVFWFDSTVDSTTSESKTYLVVIRAKASEIPTSYLPQMAITYYPTGSTVSKFLYFSFIPTTEWKTFYVIANIPANYYLKDITMCFCNRGITYYVDWITAYDITGTSFDNMTFAARATAYSEHVLKNKTFYKDGILYSGTMPTVEQATPSININPSTGVITASSTQSTGYVSGSKKEAEPIQLNTYSSGSAHVPTINDLIVVPKNYYTLNNVYMKGDGNLVPENIKSGVSIFGVNGKMEQGIVPAYTSYTNVVDIDPGTSYGVSAGTYLPNGLTVYANDVIIDVPSDITYKYDTAGSSYCNRLDPYVMEITKNFDFSFADIVSILLYAYKAENAIEDPDAILFLWYEMGLNGISPHGRVMSTNDYSGTGNIVDVYGNTSGSLIVEIDSSENYVFDSTSGYRAEITYIVS